VSTNARLMLNAYSNSDSSITDSCCCCEVIAHTRQQNNRSPVCLVYKGFNQVSGVV
jgi:hypothetical protein